MIARDCVDRLTETVKREIEVRFIVVHGSRRVDYVGRYNQEFDIIVPSKPEIVRYQRVLRRVPLARVPDNKEAEIPGTIYSVRLDAEQFVATSVDAFHRINHAGAPGIDANFS